MLGNVDEWCHDWAERYPVGSATDPWGPETGLHRIERGGSWVFDALFIRAADRPRFTPGLSDNNLGLRPARSLEPGLDRRPGHLGARSRVKGIPNRDELLDDLFAYLAAGRAVRS
jgi:hypothetical protein